MDAGGESVTVSTLARSHSSSVASVKSLSSRSDRRRLSAHERPDGIGPEQTPAERPLREQEPLEQPVSVTHEQAGDRDGKAAFRGTEQFGRHQVLHGGAEQRLARTPAEAVAGRHSADTFDNARGRAGARVPRATPTSAPCRRGEACCPAGRCRSRRAASGGRGRRAAYGASLRASGSSSLSGVAVQARSGATSAAISSGANERNHDAQRSCSAPIDSVSAARPRRLCVRFRCPSSASRASTPSGTGPRRRRSRSARYFG